MSNFAEIKTLIDGIGSSFEQYKAVNDQRLSALQRGDFPRVSELEQKLSRIERDLSELSNLKNVLERLEELESRQRSPGLTTGRRSSDEHTDTFVKWIRAKGDNRNLEDKLRDFEAKDITVGSNAGGGYALPKQISDLIERFELKYSPVRQLIPVTQVGTTDFHQLLNLRGTTSGWVGETGSRSASNTPQLRDIVPTFGELYAYPQISEWSTDDLQFNVETWLAENVADEFSRQEGIAVLTGNGTNKPTGIFNTSPVTTSDGASPVRAAAALQYITATASPFSINANDALFTCVYTLNSAYRSGASWAMNSNSIASIRKLKAVTSGDYLWQPSMQQGQPDRLLGYPLFAWEDMSDIASGANVAIFGDFSRGYLLCQRVDLRITRDPFTNPGQIRFYVRRREGGIIKNNDALKVIQTS